MARAIFQRREFAALARTAASRGIAVLILALSEAWVFGGEPAVVQAMKLAREGAAAAEAKDTANYLAKMEAAVALRPDFPRMLLNLAAAQVAAEKPDEALVTLERLAALGLASPSVEKSEDFAPLRPRKEFAAVVKKLAANAYPRGSGEVVFTLRDMTGLIEGIAWREKTGIFYFGDVNARCVWRRQPDGAMQRFTPDGDELYGVFGLVVDEAHGALWAATSAVPAMRGFTPPQDGTAALAEIDLETGAVRRVIPVVRRAGDQQSHVLGDLALGEDGTVWLTDSGGPVLWRLAPGAADLEPYLESDEFVSLQGIVLFPGGRAVLSDHANGLLAVDLSRRVVRRLESPPDTSLIGIDGMALTPDGALLAIQNGLRPNRVLRVSLDASQENVERVEVLESGHITMAAPSLGCVGPDGDFFYIGNAGWTRFDNNDGQPTSAHPVPIFLTKLPKKKAPKG